METVKRYPFLAAAIIICVSIIVYSNTLKGGFVWDDRGTIASNESIRTVKNIPSFFVADTWKATGNPSGPYYRPVTNTFWALEFLLWGENPIGYHLTNIVLHALLAFLFFNLCLRTLGSGTAAFFSALIFAAHPVHTENVAWITGGDYIICALFLVSSLICYIRFTELRSLQWLVFSVASFALAVLSKEYAVMLPFFIVAYEFASKRKAPALKTLVPFALVIIIYITARAMIVGTQGGSDLPVQSRLLTSSVIFAKYLHAFFLPFDLKVLYDMRPLSALSGWETIVSVIAVSAVLLLVLYSYKRNAGAFQGLVWFLIFLFPVANIVVVLDPQMMSLRYLYMPSMGLAMLSGVYIEKILTRSKMFSILFIIIAILLSLKTFTQNGYWQNELALYGKMVSDAPASVRARNNLGVAYLEAARPWDALAEFQKAVELNPRYGPAVFNLGDTYRVLNDFEGAIFYLQEAVRINPLDSRAHNSLGLAYKRTGRYQEAVDEFNRSLSSNPNNYEAHYNLANLLAGMGLEKEAISHYIEFLRLAPVKYEDRKRMIEKMLGEKGIILN